MLTSARLYISICYGWQQAKADRGAESLMLPPITVGMSKQIGIEFIVGLAVTPKGDDCIATLHRPERAMVAYEGKHRGQRIC